MSAETKAALDAAIEAHVSDEVGEACIQTGYVMNASYMRSSDFEKQQTGYLAEYSDKIPFHSAVGLVSLLDARLAEEFDNDYGVRSDDD